MKPRQLKTAVILFLIVATIAVYWQVFNHDFVNYDDDEYVTQNSLVHAGLSREGVVWAFMTFHASNWHPLTWLSHMLDCEIYGLQPGWHHLTNLLFHIGNALLLFILIKRMTGELGHAAFVSALFALHPLHVESVAWIAQRKDVLSTFFWMLTMYNYVRYVERPNLVKYCLVILCFALGLMSKPMLVTLPLVLFLLDFWPLRRFQVQQSTFLWSGKQRASNTLMTRFLSLTWEKVPLFILSAVSSTVTILAQKSGGALLSLHDIPTHVRIGNALVSYLRYIVKMIWPHHLAFFYPHPNMLLPIWQVIGAGLFLLCISFIVIRVSFRYPYLAVGWFWYLGTLVPVVGLIQVGGQAAADRYTYVPLVGLFMLSSWGGAEIMKSWRYRRIALVTSAAILVVAFAICSWWQVRHLSNSAVLFRHALEVTDHNYLAHNNLGVVLVDQKKYDEAIGHYSKALQIQPGYAEAHNNLGVALAYQGKIDEAISHISIALRIRPQYAAAYHNLRRLKH